MITLEQIRLLDERVRKAVERITVLTEERESMVEKIETYQNRISELESLISEFKENQGEIEEGILNALKQLDNLEDGIHRSPESFDAPVSIPVADSPTENRVGEEPVSTNETDEAPLWNSTSSISSSENEDIPADTEQPDTVMDEGFPEKNSSGELGIF